MNWIRRIAVLSLLALLPLSAAIAKPKQGFSLFGGIANHTSSGEFTEDPLDGESFTIKSSGLSIGLDYQVPLNDTISLNFFLMSSSESPSSSEIKADSAGHAIIGVQARLWMNDVFAGLHMGRYSEALVREVDGETEATGGSGSGYGFALGWEPADKNYFLMVQFDNATIAYADAESKLSGFRAQAGYRWGK